MDIVGISVLIMALTLVVLAAFMIPAFIEIRRTATAVRSFLVCTESELRPALQDLQVALADLKTLTAEASTKTEDVKTFMEALGETGRNLRTINRVVGSVSGALASSSLWVTGARVAGKLILERIKKKRG